MALRATTVAALHAEGSDRIADDEWGRVVDFYTVLGVSSSSILRDPARAVADYVQFRDNYSKVGGFVRRSTVQDAWLPSNADLKTFVSHAARCGGCFEPRCRLLKLFPTMPLYRSPVKRVSPMSARASKRALFQDCLVASHSAEDPSVERTTSHTEPGFWEKTPKPVRETLINRFQAAGSIRQSLVTDEREFQSLCRTLDDYAIVFAGVPDVQGRCCRICNQGSFDAGKHHAIRCESCIGRIDTFRSYYILPEVEKASKPRRRVKRSKRSKRQKPLDERLLCGACKPVFPLDADPWEYNTNVTELLPHWATCKVCGAACHRVCAMLDELPEEDEELLSFVCPFCAPEPTQELPSFRQLPVTPIAAAIEQQVADPLLCVREVFRERCPLQMSPKLAKQFADPAPRYYTSRTIFYVYDEIPVFFLYVMEFDKEGAGANSNRVYIDYLDSVRAYSPLLNCDLLDAYVTTVRDRGFDYVHLWCAAAKNEWFVANDPPPRVPRDDLQLLAWYQHIFSEDEAHDYFDLLPSKGAFPKKFDALPVFPDLFLQFLEAKGSASQNSEVIPETLRWDNIRRAYLRYWKLSQDGRPPVTYDESDYVPSSHVCRSRDSFVEFQVDLQLRMSDYRCARHFASTLCQALLKELI